MEYKYYKQNGENYELNKPSTLLYFSMAVFVIIGAPGILYYQSEGKIGGLIWFVCCILFTVWAYYRHKKVNILSINPYAKLIQLRSGDKVNKEFPFDEFMNFQKTRVRINGITTQWHTFMYFNDNGKNKKVVLGITFRQKTADEIITETNAIWDFGKTRSSVYSEEQNA